MLNYKWIALILFTSTICIGCATLGTFLSKTEKPKYDILSSTGNIEIRQYSSMIIAEVEVAGERDEAIKSGFKLLADYIFGNNTLQQDIAMTAPVQQQNNQKIAMTSPVQQQASNGQWKVSFVMPSEYTMENLPKPNNQKVNIKQVEGKKFLALTFSGRTLEKNISKNEKDLMEYVKKNNISIIGAPTYAFYDPPWTLPFMRRNEILVEISQ